MNQLTDSEITILNKLKEDYNGDFYAIKEKVKSNIKILKEKSIYIQGQITDLKSRIAKDPTFPYEAHDPTTGNDCLYAQLLYWRKLIDRVNRQSKMMKHISHIPSIQNVKKAESETDEKVSCCDCGEFGTCTNSRGTACGAFC